MKTIFLAIIFSLLFIGIVNQATAQTVEFNPVKVMEPVVIFETNLGNIAIGFFPNDAPEHVENFLKLSTSGFYEGTLFHRIIPGFMIQGGDPNTIDGDPNTWGTGGPDGRLEAEFNDIKHNRGIVSMARSADPNSAGSQFFIVHQDSNFLDEQYTVFGRLVTEESFETLDKIASVSTGSRDEPLKPEQVRITKITIISESEIPDLLELHEPERIQTNVEPPTGNQLFESDELDIAFSVPAGWLLQQPEKVQENSPDVVAVGPKVGVMNPVISLTIHPTNGKTIDDIISEKSEELKQVIESGQLNIISQEQITINGRDAYVTNAHGLFLANGQDYNVQFKDVVIHSEDNYYNFSYSNGVDNFDSQLERFDETLGSFKKLSEDSTTEETGGCLIATATFGSELAPQVQQLRELRDNTILTTESGTAFMSGFNQLYYSFSPTIADLERESPLFKEIVKLTITPMLSTLSILNYAEINSEQEMITYGVGIILMNVGMYFAAPAIIIYKIRKLN
ncbi:Peptidyl-prolyl cis-trans isomerase protein [Marine Group I thaumarchaeote SCGC RSA3]|uniref:peptidylprolyl isomerase n=3 Tax=Marine Group I TaxID=905826 RepID=A0A081RQ54_9ARCH|nr:Peptidyl-prolyl cis-trans isomerase protein [Marine Group I thaumarchaeote SCGC AAA799-N04]KFM14405.1 Peptidyl-prolyl cis-trans isomerase protein [Marine Group I thaumarchaeote SCGC AAA799-D11]KFM20981.1 Peptidyl-prolyl cis-trans isomerase protein [Marine Group I thaumarchaeote SCGC RSA3]